MLREERVEFMCVCGFYFIIIRGFSSKPYIIMWKYVINIKLIINTRECIDFDVLIS